MLRSVPGFVQMVGPDSRMDRKGQDDVSVNVLPPKCPRCGMPDLDVVNAPYRLAKGTQNPADLALADVGNFLCHERARRILEAVAPGGCDFHPTVDAKGKPTPWSLAVPRTRVAVDEAR